KKETPPSPPSPAPETPPPVTVTQPEATKQPAEEIMFDKEGHDRTWWQAQIQHWQQQLEQASTEYDRIEARYQVLVRRFHNPAFGRRGRRSLAGEIKQLEEELTALQLRINEAKRMLEQTLPAQAAAAGAPPEWLQ
ncbi:MAG: hypothetical protein D6736_10475, partial [Nitrospinota bacterium]